MATSHFALLLSVCRQIGAPKAVAARNPSENPINREFPGTGEDTKTARVLASGSDNAMAQGLHSLAT